MAAYWGQFTKSRWSFLQHGSDVELLDRGGSYVSLIDSTGQQLTIILKTMKRDASQFAHSNSVHYITIDQTATFELDSSFGHINQLYIIYILRAIQKY